MTPDLFRKKVNQKRPEASVVILNFNGKDYLRKCLQSLQKQSHKSFEVIVSDNNSSDGSQEMVVKEFPKVRLLRNAANYGVSKGYNVGVEVAKGKYVATLANDMVLDKDWVKEAVAALKKDSKAASAGSFIQNKEGGFYKGEKVYGFYLDLLGNPLTLHSENPGYIFGPSGAIFRKDIIGLPYDNDFFYSGDEIYLGWKTMMLGYNTAQANKAKLFHEGRVSINSVKGISAFAEYHGERNRYLNLLIFYSASTLIKLLPLMLLNIIVTSLLSIFRLRLHIRLKAYWWLISHLGLIKKKRREIQRTRKTSEKNVFKYIGARIPYGLGPLTGVTNKLLLLYCFIMRLPVMELQK